MALEQGWWHHNSWNNRDASATATVRRRGLRHMFNFQSGLGRPRLIKPGLMTIV